MYSTILGFSELYTCSYYETTPGGTIDSHFESMQRSQIVEDPCSMGTKPDDYAALCNSPQISPNHQLTEADMNMACSSHNVKNPVYDFDMVCY